MKITKVSILSKIERSLELNVTDEEIKAWKAGMLIQDAMPRLTTDEREFMMTGITAQEWEKHYE
jgi:hypothetical protein